MWIQATTWYRKSDPDTELLDRLGIASSGKGLEDLDEGYILINMANAWRINPSPDNPKHSVIWFLEEPSVCYFVKHSISSLYDALKPVTVK